MNHFIQDNIFSISIMKIMSCIVLFYMIILVYYTMIYYYFNVLNKVNAEIALLSGSIMDSATSEISVQVNCSHFYDQTDSVSLKITVLHYNNIINSTTISCEDESYTALDYLKCDTSYDLMVSWIPTADIDEDITECLLHHVKNKKITCSGKYLMILLF